MRQQSHQFSGKNLFTWSGRVEFLQNSTNLEGVWRIKRKVLLGVKPVVATFFAWCTFLTSHKLHWSPGRGLHSGCGLTLSYWRLYQIFITGRGLSGCSRHRGNALWRKTAEHHLRLLTRLQRPPRPPSAESGAARHVWARTSDDAQWHHVYFVYSRAQMSPMMNPLIHPFSETSRDASGLGLLSHYGLKGKAKIRKIKA